MNTVTRAYLAEVIYKEFGLSNAESAKIVDDVIDHIIETVASDGFIKISKFGTFRARKKKARMGRNPKTKKDYPISARTVVSFQASNIMKNKLNSEK